MERSFHLDGRVRELEPNSQTALSSVLSNSDGFTTFCYGTHDVTGHPKIHPFVNVFWQSSGGSQILPTATSIRDAIQTHVTAGRSMVGVRFHAVSGWDDVNDRFYFEDELTDSASDLARGITVATWEANHIPAVDTLMSQTATSLTTADLMDKICWLAIDYEDLWSTQQIKSIDPAPLDGDRVEVVLASSEWTSNILPNLPTPTGGGSFDAAYWKQDNDTHDKDPALQAASYELCKKQATHLKKLTDTIRKYFPNNPPIPNYASHFAGFSFTHFRQAFPICLAGGRGLNPENAAWGHGFEVDGGNVVCYSSTHAAKGIWSHTLNKMTPYEQRGFTHFGSNIIELAQAIRGTKSPLTAFVAWYGNSLGTTEVSAGRYWWETVFAAFMACMSGTVYYDIDSGVTSGQLSTALTKMTEALGILDDAVGTPYGRPLVPIVPALQHSWYAVSGALVEPINAIPYIVRRVHFDPDLTSLGSTDGTTFTITNKQTGTKATFIGSVVKDGSGNILGWDDVERNAGLWLRQDLIL